MDDNLKKFNEEFNNLKGQFVITDNNTVERFVALGDDNEDWYYITWNGRDLHWWSCVGRIIPLKGHIKDSDYEYLVRIARLNDFDQICNNEEFDILLKEYLKEYSPNHKFITDFCWESV